MKDERRAQEVGRPAVVEVAPVVLGLEAEVTEVEEKESGKTSYVRPHVSNMIVADRMSDRARTKVASREVAVGPSWA